jgi:hypothetical protein
MIIKIESRWDRSSPWASCVLDGKKINQWVPTLPDPSPKLQKGPKTVNYPRFFDVYVWKEIKKG